MTEKIASLDGLVPDRLAPRTPQDRARGLSISTVDIGFHDFEVGNAAAAAGHRRGLGRRARLRRRRRARPAPGTMISCAPRSARWPPAGASTCRRRWCARSTIWSRRAAASPRCASRPASRTSIPIAPASASSWRPSNRGSAAAPVARAGAEPLDHQPVIGPDRARLLGAGFAQRSGRGSARRQRAGEPVPEQGVRPRRRRRVVDDLAQRHRPARLLAGPAQHGQRDRAIVGGLQEDLGLALAGQRAGDVEGAADAGDSRRRAGDGRFAQDLAQPRRASRRERRAARRARPAAARRAGSGPAARQQQIFGAAARIRAGAAARVVGQVDEIADPGRQCRRRRESARRHRPRSGSGGARPDIRRLALATSASASLDPDMGDDRRRQREIGEIGIAQRRRGQEAFATQRVGPRPRAAAAARPKTLHAHHSPLNTGVGGVLSCLALTVHCGGNSPACICSQ